MASSTVVQVPSIILPTVAPIGTETETIDDLVEHTSIEFPTEFLQDKQIMIVATEVALGAVVPGPLWMWVELSPYPSVPSNQWTVPSNLWLAPLPTSTAYWAAIGGGGGVNPATLAPYVVPTAPTILAGTGVNLAQQTAMIAWAMHSVWARVVIQTPVAAALPGAYWAVQVLESSASH